MVETLLYILIGLPIAFMFLQAIIPSRCRILRLQHPALLVIISTVAILFICPLPSLSQSTADKGKFRKELLKGIEEDYSGDFDRAWETFEVIRRSAPLHPAPDFFQASILFGRNSVDASNPRYNEKISNLLTGCVEKSEAWLDSDPENPEALHYMGLCYTYQGRLEAHQGHLYRGGVLGETGRYYLEIALAECEENQGEKYDLLICEDLHFPFGAYSYFAGRLPRFLRLLSFLWFIPSGSTEEGLTALERARENSGLHSRDTTNLLISIYSLFEEDQAKRALELSREMAERYPDNPGIDLVHAEVLNLNGLHGAAVRRAESIIKKVSQGVRNYDYMLRLGALLVMAEADMAEGRLDAAEKRLLDLRAKKEYQNNTLTPGIPLTLGMVYDLQGRREEAMALYEEVLTYEGRARNRQAGKKAERYLEQPFK
jgi:tetratricopeptide (TPR) repeat protein